MNEKCLLIPFGTKVILLLTNISLGSPIHYSDFQRKKLKPN